jgi:hypothetical protein
MVRVFALFPDSGTESVNEWQEQPRIKDIAWWEVWNEQEKQARKYKSRSDSNSNQAGFMAIDISVGSNESMISKCIDPEQHCGITTTS